MSEDLVLPTESWARRIKAAVLDFESRGPNRGPVGFDNPPARRGGSLPLGTRTGQVLAMVTDDTAAYAVPFFVDNEA